jgi:hypothetical protein
LTTPCDLVTPDGKITSLKPRVATIKIERINPRFVGYEIDPQCTVFNLKSTLAQLGINAKAQEIALDRKNHTAEARVELIPIGSLAQKMVEQLTVGAYIGKLFAIDDRRRVRDPKSLPHFGDLEMIDGRVVSFLPLLDGVITYEETIYDFLPLLAKALTQHLGLTRQFLHLHHHWKKGAPRLVRPGEILLVRTKPIHISDVYGHVVDSLLPQGVFHTSANLLQPDTTASGDIYELFGNSPERIDAIPIEFFRSRN